MLNPSCCIELSAWWEGYSSEVDMSLFAFEFLYLQDGLHCDHLIYAPTSIESNICQGTQGLEAQVGKIDGI